MENFNDYLGRILDRATYIQQDAHPTTKEAAGALRYAVLKCLEEEADMDVMVKYGDADACRDTYGQSNDRVWGVEHREGWTLFRVEPKEDLSPAQVETMHRHFLAIGAWYVGETEPIQEPEWTHYHYLWPNDHPVLQMLPEPPAGD